MKYVYRYEGEVNLGCLGVFASQKELKKFVQQCLLKGLEAELVVYKLVEVKVMKLKGRK